MTLGEFLRQERERQGITIEQVASATKINIRILHALEGDRFSELPAKPFIRGFVTAYCRFIELDAKEVLSTYDTFIQGKVHERPNRESGHSGYVFEKKDNQQQSRTILFITMCSFIAVGGIAMLIFKPSLHHHRKSQLEKLRAAHSNSENATAIPSMNVVTASTSAILAQVPIVSPPLAEPAAIVTATTPEVPPPPPPVLLPEVVPSPSPLPSVSPSPSADPLDSGLPLKSDEIHHKVLFNVLDDVWVRYQVDDRPVRKFIIRKGKMLVLRAKHKIQFQVSHPEAISYNYNRQGSKLLADEPNSTYRDGNFTLFFPRELAETTEKPFGASSLLPTIVPPPVEKKSQE